MRSARPAGSRAETPAVRTLPPFSTNWAALAAWIQRTSRVFRHYPPTSLLLYALSKQWKSRTLVLTSSPCPPSGPPTHTTSFSSQSQSPYSTLSSSSQPQHVAHLHVFKSDGVNDREMERVEIGADSVVFVADEEIGGRRGVVKVGGVGGAEMTLSMADQSEWIDAIKQAVLSERSVRAGLGALTHSNGVEPRGDLDVMLSMRAQGIFTPPPPATPVTSMSSAASHNMTAGGTTSSPVPSLRSISPQLSRPPSVAVSALRGLFGANRPRSPSAATLDTSMNVVSERDGTETPPPMEDSSFGRAGTSLLSMLRSNSVSGERPLSPTTPISSVPTTPRVGTTSPVDLPIQMGLISPPGPVPSLDQKILQDHDRDSLLPSIGRDRNIGLGLTGLNGGSLDEHVTRFHSSGIPSFGSASLQPPPRRRAWTASGAPPVARANGDRNGFAYTHANLSTAETLGVRHNGSAFLSPPVTTSPAMSTSTSPSVNSPSTTSSPKFSPSPSLSPSLSANGGGGLSASPSKDDGQPRSSWSSVSSLGSGEQQPPRTSFEFGTKRWSRQGVLPRRLSPPNGPPPATPPSGPAPLSPSSPGRTSLHQQRPHPYAADSPPSRSSSQRSAHSPQSIISGFQSFSKRASGSSQRSDSTVSTTQSHATPAARGSGLLGQALTLSMPQATTHVRPRSSHRVSMPPPQRPVPSMALPPTPQSGVDEFGSGGSGRTEVIPLPSPMPLPTLKAYPTRPPHSAPATKTTFRETFTLRASRFSLSPPTTQPPSSALPPRPDEVPATRASRHRRSTSGGTPNLPTIPASPNPLITPAAPPNGPLPPPPIAPTPSRPTPTLLIKRRLRMLSAPSPSPPPSVPIPNPPSPAPSSINPYSVPSTPIGEPIISFQNDTSFMSISTTPPQSPLSVISPPLVSPLLPPPPEQSPEMRGITSLSPPPRRGSKQISVLQMEDSEDEDEIEQGDEEEKLVEFKLDGDSGSEPERKPLSLSPQASLEDVRT
ncbi:hypothetical protein BD310DRAFT_920081 [Dichomitus squalens]|uniref:PH domain-containing protein n=1 Tax=Dichomitus squalens TaxID=114155 RepID=A0A4Q9Q5J7_9APHY|nr:hypothetical protein BD310DRAFT_920081 [Dichomitus squalens]